MLSLVANKEDYPENIATNKKTIERILKSVINLEAYFLVVDIYLRGEVVDQGGHRVRTLDVRTLLVVTCSCGESNPHAV